MGCIKMIKKELTGNILKKGLNAYSVSMRWHNKNTHGGSFGFNIYFKKEFNRDTDKELIGYYNKEGVVYGLSFSPLYSAGGEIKYYYKPITQDKQNPLNDVLKKIDYNNFSVSELIQELNLRLKNGVY